MGTINGLETITSPRRPRFGLTKTPESGRLVVVTTVRTPPKEVVPQGLTGEPGVPCTPVPRRSQTNKSVRPWTPESSSLTP